MPSEPLSLALVAPLVTPIGPPFLGGAQVLLNDLAVGLVRRGHDITLYAAEGSAVPGVRTVTLAAKGAELSKADFNRQADEGLLRETFLQQGQLFLEIFMAIARENRYQLAHAHAFDWPAFAFGALSGVPTVHTVHLPAVDPAINNLLATIYRQNGTSHCVTVSHACAETYAPFFPFDRVIYNGLDIASMTFGAQAEDFLLFAGRMAPEKGADKAIEIALRAGNKLILAGNIYDQAFFDTKVAPLLAAHPSQLDYRGTLGRAEVYDLMRRAQGLLFTSQWQEPFGLVLAEAQAAGAPVVGFDVGAAREIVVDGTTGFLLPLNDIDGAVAAVRQLPQLDRAACRQRIATNFTIEKMLDDYEDYYRYVVGGARSERSFEG